MRHSRPEYEGNRRYRRERKREGINALRMAIVLTVSIGIVVVALVLTNSYDFSSIAEPTRTADSTQQSLIRRGGDGEFDPSASTPSGGSTGSFGDRFTSSQDSESTTSGTSSSSAGGESSIPSLNQDDHPAASVPEGGTIVAGCTIHGRVTDDWGSPMTGVRVFATTASGNVVESVTDDRGRYTLPTPTPDAVSVSISLSHVSDSSETFSVRVGDDIISLTTPVEPELSGCEVNFDSWNVQSHMVASPISSDLWPDASSIYQYTLNAESLALSLGGDLSDSSPLQVQAWCDDPNFGCDGTQDGAFFIAEGELEPDSPPIIAMLPARSMSSAAGVPDNREYHEYGHYFLSLATGDNFELPPGDTNHGGYFNNSSTRDSFVEGFAEFYSMMVSRHVDNDHNAEIYTIGADYDLEVNRLPWEAAGWWEEFTIAGLLLDLVDDDDDYAARDSGLTGVSVLDISTDSEPSGTIISGSIVNSSPLVVRNADVTVRYLNESGEVVGTQVTRALPGIIAPTRQGTFYAAPPVGLEVAQATATLGGISKPDDDDVSIGLVRLIAMITEYEREDGKKGVSNVAELYDALTNIDNSRSSTAVNLEEIPTALIDDIFIDHGFFADLDGNRIYDPEVDGPVGASSHPVTELGGETFAEFIPRHDPDPYEGSFVKINTGDADVDAIIQISMPADGGASSYAYVTPKDGSDKVELAVPPADHDAEVTIITAGKDFKPVIAFRVQADNFHEKVENGTISDLQVAPVELQAGTSLNQTNNNSTAIQFGVMIGGIAAVLIVVASMIGIRRKWGKS